MASNTQETVLTAEQLIKYRTNYRVRKLEVNNPRNHTGKDLLIYCDNDYGRLNTGSILVCLWDDHWHKIARPDHPILGEEIPWLHTYDGDRPTPHTPTPQPDKGKETASEQSIDDSDQKALNDQIRNSPAVSQLNLPPPTDAWTKRYSKKYEIPAMVTQTSTEIQEKLTTTFDKAFRRTDKGESTQPAEWRPHGGGGGPPGGGGGDGGGGDPAPGPPGDLPPEGDPIPAGPNLPANLRPVPRAHDAKPMGELPDIFNGDRTKAEAFIDQLNHYFLLNLDVPGFNSPIKKVALAITLIKGPEVTGWTRALGELLRALDPVHDNVPALWEHFEREFRKKFQDSSKQQRARASLDNHRMKWPDIDAYVSSFEELLRLVEYTAGNNESANLFLRGLPCSIATEVMKPPLPTGYEEMKQKAIDATRSSQIIQSMFGNQGNQRGPSTGNWRNAPQQGRQPPQQFFQRPQQNMRGWTPPDTSTNRNSIRNWTPPINSSIAPSAFNNRPVPMDLSRTRAPNQWGRQKGGMRNRVAQTTPRTTNNACFECGQVGHYARNCPVRRQCTSANLIDLDEETFDEETAVDPAETSTQGKINALRQELMGMPQAERDKLAKEIGPQEDFPSV